MIERLELSPGESIIALTPEITYLQKPYWCHSTTQNLKLSLLGPRRHYPYDPIVAPQPCIVFFCGGGFQRQDRSVWLPELVFFAKHGYTVATVDYSTYAFTEFPDQLVEVKSAIRFLRAHAEELNIDPEKMAVMGESAGGQLACWAAATGDDPAYRQWNDLDQSDAIQCCAAWYPVTHVNAFPKPDFLRIKMDNFPDTCQLVDENTPPFFLMHGTGDSQVPYTQSVRLHDQLESYGVECQLLLLENADHSDPRFVLPEMQRLLLAFFDQHLSSHNK